MDVLFCKSNEPSYNSALENYLLKNKNGDFVLFYINKPSIISGRFQVPYSEIDYNFARSNNIPFFRRLSGGGTVVHDFGNLNYAFITNHIESVNYYDYYNSIIISALESLSIKNLKTENNNILYNGNKVSGTAQYKVRKRLLHHGTLLVDSNLDFINFVLIKQSNYSGRMSSSRPMTVGNLKDFFGFSINTQIIIELIISAIIKKVGGIQNNLFLNDEIINTYQDRLKSLDWIIGASPVYHFEKSFIFRNEKSHLSFDVKNGLIINQIFLCNSINFVNIEGKRHEFSDIFSSLTMSNNHFNHNEIQYLLTQMF